MIGIIAAILLTIRVIAVRKLYKVLKTQIELLRRPIDPEVWEFRRSLHYMTLALLVGNILPIVLDFLVVLDELGWIAHYRTIFVITAYAISNAVMMLIAVTMIKRMYDLANQADEVDRLEKAHVRSKGDRIR